MSSERSGLSWRAAPCGLALTDADSVILDANDTLLGWLGIPLEEALGVPLGRFIAPGDRIFYDTRYTQTLQLRGEVSQVVLTLRGGGVDLPVLLNSRFDGSTVSMALFPWDTRRDYERDLLLARRTAEESEGRLRLLAQSARDVTVAATEDELAEALAENARVASAARSAAVVLMDRDGDLQVRAGEHPLWDFARSPAGKAAVEPLNLDGVTVVSSLEEAGERMPGLVDALRAARVEAFTMVPISGTDGPIGALLCFFGRARRFEPDDISLQVALVDQASQALSRLRLQADLERMALRDPLTGLANRRLLREHLEQVLASSAAERLPVALMVLDLDGFKLVNDTFGHPSGDEILRSVAEELRHGVRGHDVVGRIGGDEFLILCPGTDAAAAEAIAERVRASIASRVRVAGQPSVTVSIGIAAGVPLSSTRPEDLFAAADAAMYRSKNAGRDRVTATAF